MTDLSAFLPEALSQKRRLRSLFLFQVYVSAFAGLIAFVFPKAFGVFFTDGSVSDGVHSGAGASNSQGSVAHFMIRLYGALLGTQAWLVWVVAKVDDGYVKRAFIQGYFGCFAASLAAVVAAHAQDDGTMAGHFFGALKIVILSILTAGYGWFAFFPPPAVYELPRDH
mmetsp:Transcript_30981/g.99401  ORF Transcript_30981/g.99401 Transcript_30981/m.99401 type:complete len:168 (-) Transcript_30981:1517-2020(-)